MSLKGVTGDLDETPPTLPTVGTNLTDITINKRRITIRELGGCMGPIWPSYYGDSEVVMFVIDAANPTQISSSCIQLLEVLTAEQLQETQILILFNKVDLPCHMSLVEMKSLFRLDDILACSKQRISVLEVSARTGRGLDQLLKWLHTHLKGRHSS